MPGQQQFDVYQQAIPQFAAYYAPLHSLHPQPPYIGLAAGSTLDQYHKPPGDLSQNYLGAPGKLFEPASIGKKDQSDLHAMVYE